MRESLSDADLDLVATAIVDFSSFIFNDGEDRTQFYLEQMSPGAKREYFRSCDDVLTIWRSISKYREEDREEWQKP